MKIKLKQLDLQTRNTISLALEYYASYISQVDDRCSDKYLELATRIKHAEVLLAEYQYPAPEDDVQVLGKEGKEATL